MKQLGVTDTLMSDKLLTQESYMNKKILNFSIIIILITANAFAQNAQELRIGSFINGNLGHGQEIWYRVTATEDGFLTVETTGSTDTYLEAFDAQQNYITENDDGGEGYNAKIDIIVTRGTSYLFKLRGYDYENSGPYRIFASSRPMPTITELRIGSSHNGNIESGEEYWFRFRASETGILTVETTGYTDTYLEAYASNYNFLDADDDGGEDTNAKLEIDVSAGETYIFKLRGYSDYETGTYRLTSSFRNFPTPVPLNPGTFQAGNITEGQEFWYSVRAPRRGRLIVETTGSTDTFLYVYSDSYEFLLSDDDGGEETNARIELSAEANYTYIFRLRGFSKSTTGSFRVFASIE